MFQITGNLRFMSAARINPSGAPFSVQLQATSFISATKVQVLLASRKGPIQVDKYPVRLSLNSLVLWYKYFDADLI